MLGDLVVYTGWTYTQAGQLTLPQIRATMRAINRRRKEQVDMWTGTTEKAATESGGDMTASIEAKLALLRAQTGRSSFDLREVL